MKLIRRKQSPTTFERIAKFVGLGAKGLAAQRIARRGVRGYKFTKRAIPLAGLGALAAVIAKKARGGGGSAPEATPGSTPPATGSPSRPTTESGPSAESGPPAESGPSAEDSPPADASGTDDTLEVEAPNQSTPPPPEKAAKS